MPSPKAGLGASEHQTSGSLEHALNRTLSWDLPQPPRRKEKIRKNIDQLRLPASAPLNEDGLPTPEPFKIKMVETIALLPRAKREALLAKAGFNVFCLRSDQVCLGCREGGAAAGHATRGAGDPLQARCIPIHPAFGS
jgi:hypothetical protein